MMNVSRLAMICLVVTLSGCGHQSQFLTKDGELTDSWSAVSTREFVKSVGIGVAPADIKDRTRRRGISRNSALVNARVEMIAFLRGVRIRGHLDVSRLAEQRDMVREIVDATVANAETEITQWTADDGCVVVLRIERSKIKKMLREAASSEAADTDETIATLEKQIALMDSRTKALITAFPGMKAE
jgi:hypothetical protein